jgi:DNA mismatch repair protein MutS2
VNSNSYRTLEFETIRALVLSYAGSASGRAQIEALAPQTSPAAVVAALGRTSEAVQILQSTGRQPYHELPDIAEHLAASRVVGLHLEARDLSDVASFIEGANEIGRRVSQVSGAPELSRLAVDVPDATPIAAAIRRAVLPTGEVADNASPRLADVRRALARSKAQLQSVMESYLKGKDADRILQDKLVTTRNDRYVLLLKAEHRGQVPGIIHGASGSGASLFVEPMPAVELNNDIVGLIEDERAEVVRILTDLTARVGERADVLERGVEILGLLDAAQAMALTARDMRAIAPSIIDAVHVHVNVNVPGHGMHLALLEARHPLLMVDVAARVGIERRSFREPVPVTLRIEGASALVISGPNTGGKTVALKTIGLLALMAQSGLHIPVAEGSALPVFQRIYADIGDEQSIAANLSTFSAHLANIVDMTRDLAAPALVLLDEVGAGTDPTEGGALGVAIVDHFRQRGAFVVATTHHGLMKAYAQSTPGVACASFGYDPETYEPTYQLAMGVAGRSLALEMAERLGLPKEAMADARARLDVREAQAEALLKKLEEDSARLRAEAEQIAVEREAVNVSRAEVERARLEVEHKKRLELTAFKKDLQKRGEDASRKAADAIHAAVKRLEEAPRKATTAGARARTEAIGAIREAQEQALSIPGIAVVEQTPAASVPLVVGGRARVTSLGVIGEVMSLGANDGPVEIAVSGKRLVVPRSEVLAVAGHAPSGGTSVPAGTSKGAAGGGGRAEINLVGMTVDEALPQVDKLLDEAAMGDRKELRVIHGFGSGRLRKAVAKMLEGHPHVAAVRIGAEGRGGVTVVELKE